MQFRYCKISLSVLGSRLFLFMPVRCIGYHSWERERASIHLQVGGQHITRRSQNWSDYSLKQQNAVFYSFFTAKWRVERSWQGCIAAPRLFSNCQSRIARSRPFIAIRPPSENKRIRFEWDPKVAAGHRKWSGTIHIRSEKKRRGNDPNDLEFNRFLIG